jgi:hypothetical protein
MYIILRDTVNAWNNPNLTRTGSFWHYCIFQVADGYNINLADFNNAVQVPDNLAQAWRFIGADLNHALTIKPTKDGIVSSYADLVSPTLNSFTPDGSTAPVLTKQIYYLTDQDQQDAIAFMQLAASLHIRDNTPLGQEQAAQSLRSEINGITDLIQMKQTFDVYFNTSTYWKRSDLDKLKVHNVNYVFQGHDIPLAKNV